LISLVSALNQNSFHEATKDYFFPSQWDQGGQAKTPTKAVKGT
jgi:hypothetical protein